MHSPPPTRREAIVETIHGHPVPDPYRWLEDGENPEVQQWVAAQNAYTAGVLTALPYRRQIAQRLEQHFSVGLVGAPEARAGRYFYIKQEQGQNQPVLYVRDGLDQQPRTLIDPNKLSEDCTVAMDWWYPSEDGKRLAYGLSSGGSEKSTLFVLGVDTARKLPEEIPRTRFCSLAWRPDGKGFYYTRNLAPSQVPPGEENYHRRVYYHELGTDPNSDPEIFGSGRSPQDLYAVSLSPDGRWLLVTAFHGWARSELYLRDLKRETEFALLTQGLDALFYGQMTDKYLYIHTNYRAPRYRLCILRLDENLTKLNAEKWEEVIPETDATLQATKAVGNRLFAHYLRNAASQLQVFTARGKLLRALPLPTLGTLSDWTGRWDGDELFFGFTSFFVPPTVYRYDIERDDLTVYDRVESDVVPSAYEVRQVWYNSKDGTPVSMFLAHRKGLGRNGENPTLLTGYGGFNIAMTPLFARNTMILLEQGGVLAMPNLRGGSEYGEAWHRAGMLAKKQDVVDDFIAAGEWLIREGYSNPQRLAIMGRSNGGLLVGAALTQRPELFRAVVCAVPLLDMVRYHHYQVAKYWIPEYGSPEDPAPFRWLYAYSPYHRVHEGTAYPATLLTTAESDSRVDPMHARKMTAALQAATSQSAQRPVLLRAETKAGHGMGKPVSKLVEEFTDIWSFLFWQLGVAPQATSFASRPKTD